MKKILAVGLASAMVMSMGAVAMAKNEAVYPVGAIRPDAHKYNSDLSAVDMGSILSTVAYG